MSKPKAILRIVRLFAARNAQVLNAEIAAQMANIQVLDFCCSKPVIMAPNTANQPVTYRHANILPESGEHDEFIPEKSRLHLAHLGL